MSPSSPSTAPCVEDMRRLVGDLLAMSGATTLLVTHALEDAARLAHRAVVFGGRPATILADLPLDGAPATRTAADMARLVSALAATN